MNPLIKELASKALKQPDTDNDGLTVFDNDELEKFAELIVQECMEVASPNYMSTPEDSVYYVEQAINRIAEHFGVEE